MLKTLLLAALLVAPAWADLQIAEVRISHPKSGLSVRVNLYNTLATRQAGPVTVIIFARQHDGDSWQKVKDWTDIPFVGASARLTRTLDKDPTLQKMADNGGLQIKAQVSAPGLSAVQQEATYTPSP